MPKRSRGYSTPKRRVRRRRARKRGIRKRAGINTSSTRWANRPSRVVIKGSSIIPEQMITRLPYSSLVQTSTSLTNVSTQTFRSSIFDPDLTGAGFFPLGYTELKDLYTKYVCYGISYDILAVNMSSTVPARICVLGANLNTAWNTFQEAASQPGASKALILGVLTGSNNVVRQKGFMSVANVNGVNKSTVQTDDLYRAAFTANPPNTGYLQILHSNLDGSATTDVHLQIHLKMYIKAFDLKALTQTS